MNRPRKLVLNRETVRDLTNPELLNIEGGNERPETKGLCFYTTNASNAPLCDLCERTCGCTVKMC